LGVGDWYAGIDADGKENFKKTMYDLFRSACMVTLLGGELSVMEQMSDKIMSGQDQLDPNMLSKFIQQPNEMSKLADLFKPERMSGILENLQFLIGGSGGLSEDMKTLQEAGKQIITETE